MCVFRRSPTLGCFALVALPLGCKSAPREDPTPTEPWMSDETPRSTDRVHRRLSMEIVPGGELEFQLKGKERQLRGRVPVESGRLELDPDALEHTRGELSFSLDRLEVFGEEGAALGEETTAARLALGLGHGVERTARLRASRASFRILHAKGLSSRAAHRGKPIVAQDEGEQGTRKELRRITGTVEGELGIRGIEVHHSVRLQLDFVFDPRGEGERLPQELRVRLDGAERVSLAEHEVVPRDEAGRVIAARLEAFRKGLSQNLLVVGELGFRPASHP